MIRGVPCGRRVYIRLVRGVLGTGLGRLSLGSELNMVFEFVF